MNKEKVSDKQDSDSEGEGSERVKQKVHSEKPRDKAKRKGEKVREKVEMSVACSPEISRKGINKKEGKKIVKPHFESERETERRKTKATYEKEKSEVVDDHSADYNTNQKQKRRKEVNIESDNESSTSSSDSEIVSPPLQSKTKRKEAPAQCAESFQQKEGKTKGRKRENKGHEATHKATATECSKRPTHKSKISKQVKSESEEELSSATVSEESDNEKSEVEPKRKAAMPKVRKQNFAHKEQIEKKRTGDKRIDKKAKQLASGKEKCPKRGPKSSNESEGRGIPQVKKAAVVPLEPATDDRSQEECEEEQEWDSDESEEEEDSEQNEEEETGPGSEINQVVKKRGRGRGISSEKKATATPLEHASDDIIEVESGGETRDLDDRSEDEDSEQKSSSEEEEAGSDGESSAATSEEKEKRIAAQPERRKHVEQRKEKPSTENASATASRYDVPERSDPSPRGGVKGAKKKKKIKHKEREMDQSVKPSSSLSTSPEERPKQPTSRGQRRKTGQREGKKGKRRRRAEGLMVMSSSETDDSSSPECDVSNNLTEDEAKKISKVFKRFFGKLCYGIVNPVEIAAQLQEKHLISQETMIDMLNSPETKQAKTISLVLKLSKRIESRPYRMYRFIEVLLGNSVLQGAGREILRETGM